MMRAMVLFLLCILFTSNTAHAAGAFSFLISRPLGTNAALGKDDLILSCKSENSACSIRKTHNNHVTASGKIAYDKALQIEKQVAIQLKTDSAAANNQNAKNIPQWAFSFEGKTQSGSFPPASSEGASLTTLMNTEAKMLAELE